MRHRKRFNSLGRKSAHRKETLSSLATALILHKRINTTVAKAKALRTYVEPLITKSKEDSTHSRRTVFSYLKNKYAVSELFREISLKVADRPGGYTRILKTGFRKGDGAEMCFIELVDYNTTMLKTEEDTQQKRTRRGRSRRKPAGEEVAEQPRQKPVAVSEPDAEAVVAESAEKPQETVAEVTDAPEEVAAETTSQKTDQQPEETVEEEIPAASVAEEPAEEKKEAVAEKQEEEVEEAKEEKEDEEDVPEADDKKDDEKSSEK